MLLSPLALIDLFGQKLEVQDFAVVALLVVLEGMLSIDNALVLGLLAKRLPKHEQGKALWYGLAGAFVFRVLAVLLASLLLKWTFAKFLGGAYLVYIAVRHLFFEAQEKDHEKIVVDAEGQPRLIEDTGEALTEAEEELEIRERVPVYMTAERRKQLGLASFWPTVLIIELTDIAFAVDSILAAIAMVGSPPKGTPADAVHPKLWVIIVGGILGLMLMRVAAKVFIQLLERFPRFEVSAYLLVIIIGLKLLADWSVNSDWSFDSPKFLGSRMGAWKERFEDLEVWRRDKVHEYEDWLRREWPLGLAEHHPPAAPAHSEGGDHAQEPGTRPQLDHDPLHVPHLLDFHSPRRPEFIIFWALMVICFALGFVPKRQRASDESGERGASAP
jgi:YkoY family integral membrane protein